MWALFILAPSSVLLLLALPRALEPSRMPILQLDRRDAADVMATDRELLARVPDNAAAASLAELWASDTAAQRSGVEEPDSFLERRRALKRELLAFGRQFGVGAPLALRARATQTMERAIAGELPQGEADAAMGTFANQLSRHALVVGGRVVAPRFVVRALFKARWNRIHGLPTDHGLAQVERQAVHGWLGLHSNALATDARLLAIKTYAEAGGADALEAQAIVLFRAGDYDLAVAALEAAQQQGGGLRNANYLLGARVAAGLSGEDS